MLSADLHKKIKKLELKASHMVTDILSGDYQSSFKGRGMEFDEVREYQPGDDIRAIDWNVTARTGLPHIKVFREEREMTLMILLDVSASLFYGSGTRTKLEIAAEIAAVFAYLALRNNDKVGLLLFSDHVELFIPPRKGRGHIWRIIQSVLSHEPTGGKTDFSVAINHLLKLSKRKNLCVFISDYFVSKEQQGGLKHLAARHDTIAIQVADPLEKEVKRVGLMSLVDSETGDRAVVNTNSDRVKQNLKDEFDQRLQDLQKLSGQCGFDFLQLLSSDEVIDGLQSLFHRRASTGRKRR